MIGSRFELKRSILGNPIGAMGYVFNEYIDLDDISRVGVQIIFPNGEYDGFSAWEQDNFLVCRGTDSRYTDYKFKNVMQVSKDFQNGYWVW